MKLLNSESVVKVYHHYWLFFVWRSVKIWIASLPFFLLLYIFNPILPVLFMKTAVSSVLGVFAIINAYDVLIYFMDKLIITTQRLIHVKLINPFRSTEIEAMLDDLQDVETEENGFFAKLPFFNFGSLVVETASTRTVINFDEAQDPEAIKFFLTNICRKHNELEKQKNSQEQAYIINQNTESSSSKVVSL